MRKVTGRSLLTARKQGFFVPIHCVAGKKHGGFLPKYRVFGGFHMATCYP